MRPIKRKSPPPKKASPTLNGRDASLGAVLCVGGVLLCVMEDGCEGGGSSVAVFAQGIFYQMFRQKKRDKREGGGGALNMKWDVSSERPSLLFMNSPLWPFSADVSVTCSATVSNESRKPSALARRTHRVSPIPPRLV